MTPASRLSEPMTAGDVTKAAGKFGGQRALSKLVGVNDRTVRRWVSGETGIPLPICALIRCLMLLHANKLVDLGK